MSLVSLKKKCSIITQKCMAEDLKNVIPPYTSIRCYI